MADEREQSKDIFGEESDGDAAPSAAPASKRLRTEAAAGAGSDGSSSSGSSSGDSSSDDSSSDSDSDSSSSGSEASSASSGAQAANKKPLAKRRLMKQTRPQRVRTPAVVSKTQEAVKPVDKDKEQGSGDEYESDADVKETADDRAFIDAEGDDDDLVKEYDEMKQDFNDERPVHSKSKKKKARKAADSDGEEPGQEKAAKGGKRKREMSDKEKAVIVRQLLDEMVTAARQDRKDRAANKPATHKLRLLNRVRQVCANSTLQIMLLEGCNTGASSMGSEDNPTILSVLREWLRPLPGTTIPPLALREAIYDVIDKLPIRIDDLKPSRIGEVLYALSQHEAEEPRNREKLAKMIERYSRSIFGKSERYRGNIDGMLDQQRSMGLVSGRSGAGVSVSDVAPVVAPTGALTVSEADFGQLLGDEIAASVAASAKPHSPAPVAPEPSMRHAKIPAPVVMDFVVRPQGLATATRTEKGGKQKEGLAKSVVTARRTVAKKLERGVKISIEGRGVTY